MAFTATLLVLTLVALPCWAQTGQPNRPPSLTRIADILIRAGTSDRATIEASDPDRDALSFRVASGPSFVSVKTVRLGHGVAQGEIRVAVDLCARGISQCIIEVTDGHASDTDTILVIIRPIVKPPPPSPMRAGNGVTERIDWSKLSPIDAPWIVGEWEWQETFGESIFRIGPGPAQKGYRRRIIFHRSGSMEMFEIGSDLVVKSMGGTYKVTLERGSSRLDLSAWMDRRSGNRGATSFAASRRGSSLDLYPWGVTDAASDLFVRVPAVTQEGLPADPERVLKPFDPPSIFDDGHQTRVTLPDAMKAALRACDPSFHVWEDADARALNRRERHGPSAITGDFDGDLLPDVALLGRSGADQVVIALLSDHGRIRATEVAWRKAFPGSGLNKSRGDPQHISPIHLERGAKGSLNPYCWVPQKPLPLDSIGIVVPGAARYDYVFDDGRFALVAPLP
jgi:hypothetical protein